jgi:GT2 family glycosyltransferase
MNNITIVSLAWNKLDLTKEFLERLKKHTGFDYQLVFTDNGSDEPIAGLVSDIYPDATLIIKDKNVGCPATRNEAMDRATGDIVFWLDNDTYVDQGWYEPFLDELENGPELGIVGVEGGRVRNPFNPHLPWQFPEYFLPSYFVDWLVGYAVAFRREAYMPICDWDLMVNMDDVDLGVGIKANGWKAKMLEEPANLKHLVTQTGNPKKVTQDDEINMFNDWWNHWSKYRDKFCNYG